MTDYIVEKGTPYICVPEDAHWWPQDQFKGSSDRPLFTKWGNTFTEDDLVIHPNRVEVRHEGEGVEIVGYAYIGLGAFAFKQNGWIMFVHMDHVIENTPFGVTKEKLEELECHQK